MEDFKKRFTKVSKKQSREFGELSVLISTFLALYLKENDFVIAAFILSFFTIAVPLIFYPLAVCWFGLSEIISVISSMILMSIVFIFIVVPTGLARKFLGKDSMRLKEFKKNKESVMVNRDHLYNEEDLLHTF